MFNRSTLYAKDPEGNIKEVRIDESGFLRVGSTGAVARTTNPTALSDGTFTPLMADDLGRLVMVPHQVRDLVATARVVLTGGSGGSSETTLLSGAASTFHDLCQVTAVNTSTNTLTAGSIQVNLRDATGGGIVASIMVPNDDTKIVQFSPPLPQNTSAAAWTVQTDSEISGGTNIIVSATFVKNV